MNSPSTHSLEQAILSVPNMVCEGCAEKIKREVASLPGIREVKVGIWRKRVRVSFDSSRVGKSEIIRTLQEANFEVADLIEP